jgi:hypothetical protein
VLVWQPKIDHKRQFMLRLMQTPIPLVIVLHAREVPDEGGDADDVGADRPPGGKKPPKRRATGPLSWQLEPTQADDILFEMFVHGWIDDEHRFHVTKYTIDELRDVFVNGEPISIETGKRLAAWANGRAADNGAGRRVSSPAAPVDDALLIKAQEFAECGTEKYAAWWQGLTVEQRRGIGAARHENYKAIAAKVPT